MPRPGIEPGTPGSLIERHNHEAKRSGPVRLVIYAPYIFTYILIICTSLCCATANNLINVRSETREYGGPSNVEVMPGTVKLRDRGDWRECQPS